MPNAPMPQEPECFGWVLDHLFSVGPVRAGMSGPEPVTHQDIAAYMQTEMAQLSPAEVGMVRRLSAEYCDQLIRSRNPTCPMPSGEYEQDDLEAARKQVEEKMRAAFGGSRK